MSAIEERQARRRREMLDAAMAIVAEEGLDGLTIVRLAERLGAAVGALYRYFDSKETLIVGLQKQALEMFHERQLQDLEEATELVRTAGVSTEVAALFFALVASTSYLEDARRTPRRHRLLDTMLSTPSQLLTDDEAREVAQTLAPVLEACAKRLRAAALAQTLDEGDATERTHVFWAVMHGLDHFRKRDRIQPVNLRVKPLLRIAFGSLLIGWGGRPPDVDAALDLLARFRPELI